MKKASCAENHKEQAGSMRSDQCSELCRTSQDTIKGMDCGLSDERLLGLDEVRRLIPVGRTTVWGWRKAGLFPFPVRLPCQTTGETDPLAPLKLTPLVH